MSGKHVYTHKNLKAIKIISLSILILMSLTTPFKLHKVLQELKTTSYSNLEIIVTIFSFSLSLLLIIFSAILIKFPQKFIFIGIESLIYSLGMTIFDSEAIMSLLMLCVTFSTLLLRSNLKKEKKKIIILFLFLYLFELFIPLRHGLQTFFECLTTRLGTTLLLGIIGFFSFEYVKQLLTKESLKERILNIATFKGLERSDMYLLQQVLDNKNIKKLRKAFTEVKELCAIN